MAFIVLQANTRNVTHNSYFVYFFITVKRELLRWLFLMCCDLILLGFTQSHSSKIQPSTQAHKTSR